jgi:branched-subunit amino acid ABC-type transport system permease component
VVNVIAQLLANGLVAGASYGLLAIAFALLYRVSGFFQFTLSSLYAVAAYAALLSVTTPSRFTLGFAAAGLAGAALALILDNGIYRRLLARRSPPFLPMLASIGAVAVIENALALIFGPSLRVPVTVGEFVVQIGPVRMTELRCAQFITCTAVALLVIFILRHSEIGTQIRAVASDSELAGIHGLPVRRLVTTVTVCAALLVSVPATFAAFDTGVKPQIGALPLLMAITAMIVGGLQSATGWLAGGIAVGILQQVAILFLAAHWSDAMMFTVFCIALLARKNGLTREIRARYTG